MWVFGSDHLCWFKCSNLDEFSLSMSFSKDRILYELSDWYDSISSFLRKQVKSEYDYIIHNYVCILKKLAALRMTYIKDLWRNGRNFPKNCISWKYIVGGSYHTFGLDGGWFFGPLAFIVLKSSYQDLFKLVKHETFWINFRFWLVLVELRKSKALCSLKNIKLASAFMCIEKYFYKKNQENIGHQ